MSFLLNGLMALTWQQIIMYLIGILLIYLAIKKDYEPALLLPIGFGTILVNIPYSGVLNHGIIEWLYEIGIAASEAMPLLLFIGIGAMIDFTPLLANPKLFLFGAAAQFGIFAVIIISHLLGFNLIDAASIGIIGAADGPTAILVAQTLGSKYIGPIVVAAYSYMALVPIIQPIVIKMITTKEERKIKAELSNTYSNIPQVLKIAFPITVTLITGLIAPASVGLVGFLMFGNLLRECGVLKTLTETAQTSLTNLITLLLGITISFSMIGSQFIAMKTLIIIGLGLLAFVFDTVAGVMFAKIINLFSKKKINPMIGAAGISAFPISARVIQKLGLQEDSQNHLLMSAIGANVSGQIASVLAGGIILSLLGG